MLKQYQHTFAYWASQAVRVAIELNIIDALENGPLSTKQLADQLVQKYPHLSQDNLGRLLRSLVGFKVLQSSENSFALSPLGEELLNLELQQAVKTQLSGDNWEQLIKLGENNHWQNFSTLFAGITDNNVSTELNALLNGYLTTKALYLSVSHGIANILSEGKLPIAELSARSNIPEPELTQMLKLLDANGYFKLTENSLVEQTEKSMRLQSGHTSKLAYLVLHEEKTKWCAAGKLEVSITDGENSYDHANGMGIFTFLEKNPETRKIFDEAMSCLTLLEIAVIQDAINLNNISEVMDVGGGDGTFLLSLLEKNPEIKIKLFDLPESISKLTKERRELLERHGEIVGGDFFKPESIPDTKMVIFKRTLHDFSDDQVIQILKNFREKCRQVLIVEFIHQDEFFLSNVDLLLMSIGGKVRDEEDYKALFSRAGIEFVKRLQFSDGISMITANAPKLIAQNQQQFFSNKTNNNNLGGSEDKSDMHAPKS